MKEPTKEKDAGQFVCTVKNESGKLTATFTVKFEVQPPSLQHMFPQLMCSENEATGDALSPPPHLPSPARFSE